MTTTELSYTERIRRGLVDPLVDGATGLEAARRSAAVIRDEVDTLADDDDRLEALREQGNAWLAHAAAIAVDPCPSCEGTGRGNPLPPSRSGPGPCGLCGGNGRRKRVR